MKVSELGEFGLIDLLAKAASGSSQGQPPRKLILGIGDDAAAWPGEAATQLATIDSLIEGVHFSLDTTTWAELGWKALAVNLSDIAAMGGTPAYALVSLALPGDTDVADVEALYRGMLELAAPSGVALAGGDTCRAPLVAITVVVLGRAGAHLLTRAAARPGDSVAVTGHPGTAAAGLEMLTKKLRFPPEATATLREAFLRPVPRIAVGQLLVRRGVKAAIDISDGLAADLGHICRASRVGARIELSRLPVAAAVRDGFGERAAELALAGGEDYELLFTAPAAIVGEVAKESACPVTVIGEITAGDPGQVSLVDGAGKPVSLPRAGWEHFKAN